MNNPLYYPSSWNSRWKSAHFEKRGDYYIVIATNGRYPDVYVSIPSKYPLKNIRENDSRIFCHGGINGITTDYLLKELGVLPDNFAENCNFISWGYAMPDDYMTGYNRSSCKQWTIQEIIAECYDVIDQLEKLK